MAEFQMQDFRDAEIALQDAKHKLTGARHAFDDAMEAVELANVYLSEQSHRLFEAEKERDAYLAANSPGK